MSLAKYCLMLFDLQVPELLTAPQKGYTYLWTYCQEQFKLRSSSCNLKFSFLGHKKHEPLQFSLRATLPPSCSGGLNEAHMPHCGCHNEPGSLCRFATSGEKPELCHSFVQLNTLVIQLVLIGPDLYFSVSCCYVSMDRGTHSIS